MMLAEIERRQERLRKMVQEHWLVQAVPQILRTVRERGSPRANLRETGTVGVHLPFELRARLRQQKTAWGLKSYRDVVFVAIQLGLEALERAPKPQEKS